MRRKLAHLPKPVRRTLLAFHRRRRFYELLRTLAAPLLCYAGLALVATHLDRVLFLDTADRVWISVFTHGVVALTGAIALGAFVWRRTSAARLAYDLEHELPRGAAERLVTLNDVLGRSCDGRAPDGGIRADLVEQLTRETVSLCENTPHAARLAHDRPLRRSVLALGLLGAVWAVLLAFPAYQFPLMLQRLTFPARNLPKPSFMRLTVTPEAPVIGRGGEVVLQVQVGGEIPRLLRHPMRWLGMDSGVCLLATAPGRVDRLRVDRNARPLSRVQRRMFVGSRGDLQESFSFRVRCGDAETDIKFVDVVAQPRATNVNLRVESPAYTGLEPATFREFSDPVPAFAGSRVDLTFGADPSPLRSARVVALQDGKTLADLEPDPATGTYRYAFEMEAPVEMELVLVNAQGFENVERVRIAMALRVDEPPGVRLEYPGGEISVAQGELIPVQVELSDDLGLQEAAICYQVNPGRGEETPREIMLPLGTHPVRQTVAASFDLAKVNAVPGDSIVLWVRARDTHLSDERSQTVRIDVTAFGGNENERRRLAALRLLGPWLAAVEPSAADITVLVPGESACEQAAASAKAKGLQLSGIASSKSILDFIEREHHFTDEAAAASEVRLLHGVVSALLAMPPAPSPFSLDQRKAELRELAAKTLPALIVERMGRDLVRRVLTLRREASAVENASETGDARKRESVDRRMDLLIEELDSTGADIAALARMSPLLDLDDVLSVTRQISRIGRDLKTSDAVRQRAAGQALVEQIDGWIGLIVPALPAWRTERLAARSALREHDDRLRRQIEGGGRGDRPVLSAKAIRWQAAAARLVERSPFLGLSERLAAAAPGSPGAAAAATNAFVAVEARLLSRMAVEYDLDGWLSADPATPLERRIAEALKAMDRAEDDAARTAAGEALRRFDVRDDGTAAVPRHAAAPASSGLYAALPAMADVTASLRGPYDVALEGLSARLPKLLDPIRRIDPSGGAQALALHLAGLEAELDAWAADVSRLSDAMYLDLVYGDPRRKETLALAAVLPTIRNDVLSRYQAIVPPIVQRLGSKPAGRSAEAAGAALALDLEELIRSVSALNAGLTRAAKQLRGEIPIGVESAVSREIRAYYSYARRLATAEDPAAVADEFFAAHPSAAAIVIQRRTAALKEIIDLTASAADVLRAETAESAAFSNAMARTTERAADFEKRLSRFSSLDPDGAVRALAGEIRDRARALVRPPGPSGTETLSRDRLAVDELHRLAERLLGQVDELVLRTSPPVPSGFWGGPSGAWEGFARRDAEHARRRLIAQFEHARDDAALGFEAVAANRGMTGARLPDAPLSGSLFAWRLLQSSLGGGTFVRAGTATTDVPADPLLQWLMSQLDETSKALLRLDRGAYREPSSRWTDSARGLLRH